MESDNDSDDSGDDYLARALAIAKQKGGPRTLFSPHRTHRTHTHEE